MAKLSQNRQTNASVFPLHPGKQVTQGCKREITSREKPNSKILFWWKWKLKGKVITKRANEDLDLSEQTLQKG